MGAAIDEQLRAVVVLPMWRESVHNLLGEDPLASLMYTKLQSSALRSVNYCLTAMYPRMTFFVCQPRVQVATSAEVHYFVIKMFQLNITEPINTLSLPKLIKDFMEIGRNIFCNVFN